MTAGTATQPIETQTTRGSEHAKKLFVVGCPRSGTTWMQLLLAQHSAIATAPETQIFAYYLEPMRRQWALEHRNAKRTGSAGLSRLLSEPDFEELCRTNAEFVFNKIAERNPSAEIIAEKSPRHALQADFIQKLYPDAYSLQVIRDPRDAVASLRAASRGWGSGWAPHNVIEGARLWRDHIVSARRASGHQDRYHEVKYEQMVADGPGELQRIHEWLGLQTDAASCAEAVAACDFSKLKEDGNKKNLLPSAQSPKEFFRSGVPGSGVRDLSAGSVRVIERICGELMDELGYARSGRDGIGARLRIATHDAFFRVRESVDWQLERLLRKV